MLSFWTRVSLPIKGREFITELYSSLPRPLLFIIAPDDPLSAIEEQRQTLDLLGVPSHAFFA
jgi:hypothetical protein